MKIVDAKARTCQDSKFLPTKLIVTDPMPLKCTKRHSISMCCVLMNEVPFDFVQMDVKNVKRKKTVIRRASMAKRRNERQFTEKENRHEKFSADSLFTMSLRLPLHWAVMAFEEITTTTATTQVNLT